MKEVFTAGLLKPGLNYEAGEKKEVKNNIPAMKQKLAEMQSTKLNWVERLEGGKAGPRQRAGATCPRVVLQGGVAQHGVR